MRTKRTLSLMLVFILVISVCFLNTNIAKAEEEKKEKVIYLTFDDGPSPNNTLKVLDILKEEKVTATFFLIGESAEKYPHIVKELNKNGMAIGAHSYTHKTSYIYRSQENYKEDMCKCVASLEQIIGKDLINIIRMPCGSSTNICNKAVKKEIKKCVLNKDLYYIDWNVTGEDAIGKNVPKAKIKRNILKTTKGKNEVVLLLHDGYYNTTTREVLRDVIQHYKKEGYTFKNLKNLPKEDIERLKNLKVLNK
ncbi:polysaccharide deacetylase family protein [Hathewaya histolytica]|uniref:Peptidoglycan N-acetylglucosamine deacetylase n=1 Tax=Hathewaya histolytica TaxID=1498 RepID=A0A4U9RMQ9_HATHI|nr:polysaccharide deacetylase family protein [Hathewaya histolytica]VTQ93494.1 peptidoglycan N-acetylglucosamine deacetylase [Hathewaya histolytica]